MSVFHIFGRKQTAPPGSLILPRSVARQGQLNWPKCRRCMRDVDAYGIENETDASIEIWARCGGVRIDPATGEQSGLMGRQHEPMKSSTIILKGPGWSLQRYTDIISRLAFFAPSNEAGDRLYKQDITAEGVNRKWSAG